MNTEQLQEKIKSAPALMLYFSGVHCSVCHDLKPKVFKAIAENYPKIEIIEISVDEYREIALQFSVFALPTLIIFLDGKEFIKKERNMSVIGLIDELSRPYELFFEE